MNRLLAILPIALFLSACNEPRVAALGISDDEFAGLVAPVPGSIASDYSARERTVRLFGVQGEPAFATVADTTTWETWNLRVGDDLGRGLRTNTVQNEIELRDATGRTVTVARGGDVALRTITHRLDESAVYVGRATWRVSATAMQEVVALHGAGVETASRLDLFPVPATELVSVAPDGALARLGFRAGDFLFELNGQPATIDAIVERAQTAGAMTVTMYRAGAPGARTFRIE